MKYHHTMLPVKYKSIGDIVSEELERNQPPPFFIESTTYYYGTNDLDQSYDEKKAYKALKKLAKQLKKGNPNASVAFIQKPRMLKRIICGLRGHGWWGIKSTMKGELWLTHINNKRVNWKIPFNQEQCQRCKLTREV